MARLVVQPVRRPLTGQVSVPSDKSIGHRALILAALGRGTSHLRHFSYGEDNVSTQEAFRSMGVAIDDDGSGTLRVQGVGLDGLREPRSALDCGNSGTTMRLLTGLLAAQGFQSRLVGDASLSRRPMARVVSPLRARGAVIQGEPHPDKPNDLVPPLVVGPLPVNTRLGPLEVHLPIASAQVKSALLLSGLWASGCTVVHEPAPSRDHTERMLTRVGVSLRREGSTVCLLPPEDPKIIEPFDIELPGDLSAAAFLLVAAAITQDSDVTVQRVGLNPTRSGVLDVLRDAGAELEMAEFAETLGEPVGRIRVHAASLHSSRVEGELGVRSIDEIPILAALAARSAGTTDFLDVGELRVKESDRIALTVALLRSFGVDATEQRAGFSVQGQPEGRLRAAHVTSGGDHRIAMTAAVLGLVAEGETVVEDVDCIATSFPGFTHKLRALGATLDLFS